MLERIVNSVVTGEALREIMEENVQEHVHQERPIINDEIQMIKI